MAKRKRKHKRKKHNPKRSHIKNGLFAPLRFLKKQIMVLPGALKRYILGSLMFLLFLISLLSFIDWSGKGGRFFKEFFLYWVGAATYLIPLIFILFCLTFLLVPKALVFAGLMAGLVLLLGITGIFSLWDSVFTSGGRIGAGLSNPLQELFGELVASCIFLVLIGLSLACFKYLFSLYFLAKKDKETVISKMLKKVRAFPKFRVSEVEPERDIGGYSAKQLQQAAMGQKAGGATSAPGREIKFIPPPLDFLAKEKEKAYSGNIKENALIIKKTLENFGIEVAMTGANVGPTVTQYAFKPAQGVRLSKITALSNNLALALAAHPIRIEAPIPGKSLVGIEVPNKVRSKVRLRDLLGSSEFGKLDSGLSFALGRDVAGAPVFSNLARLPHLLVAGSTGTGKTIFLNSFILSLLYQNSPANLKFILIDPKRVEFVVHSGLPHLICPVILDADRAVHALKWLVQEMERRFVVLAESKVKDIAAYNSTSSETLPYIVLIVDELADLMAAKGKEIEASVVRIAQMARAVGIHLVLATQRPSVEVITGLIKANITSRISFQVASQFDARTILDMAGSEKLLGLGDMLYISADSIKPKRIQGAFVSEKEVKKVVEWINKNALPEEPDKDPLFKGLQKFNGKTGIGPAQGREFEDVLYDQAKTIVIQARKASASLLQRRLQIGYARAARLLDMLEAQGVIGPPQGAKPRKVYFEPENEEFYE